MVEDEEDEEVEVEVEVEEDEDEEEKVCFGLGAGRECVGGRNIVLGGVVFFLFVVGIFWSRLRQGTVLFCTQNCWISVLLVL